MKKVLAYLSRPPHKTVSRKGFHGKGMEGMGDTLLLLLVAVAAFLLGRLSASVKVVGFRAKLDDPGEPRRGMSRSLKGE